MILRGETGSAGRPAAGTRAPGFAVRSHEGKIVSLDQFAGRSHLVLFFFPKADTPG
ncbi:MAG TPA: redoxin domain-containing protein [Candidatus Saccharimonadales bacterium]|nr:redoxin domain-containing protein [Candidatus Saccharimonadales bacterium]